MTSKKRLENKVEDLEEEEETDDEIEKSFVREFQKKVARLEGKDPSEIEETDLGELIRRIRKAME
ncbi:hypothetical protein AKJ36_02825 [candidate division MSBL1 archaeon SCGC-AAA259I07]|uniref:Uncharacterized protein n=1 Tax=candidate division MSBL1 archaeon SCGC-AAA259I07 TaxID=1698266 RepID=A0A133UJS8_9EURY|nr:hypothetical protein AKJ36_02825 [candidate division MSBL1 archaeon SCGC-AAA259I07]